MWLLVIYIKNETCRYVSRKPVLIYRYCNFSLFNGLKRSLGAVEKFQFRPACHEVWNMLTKLESVDRYDMFRLDEADCTSAAFMVPFLIQLRRLA